MRQMKLWGLTALLVASLGAGLTACKGTGASPVRMAGTLEEALPADSAPASVMETMERGGRFHQHDILNDTANSVSVFSIDEVDDTSTEGYGIVVVKGATSTTFPSIVNEREPQARYDSATGDLWLTSSVMAGTGVRVDRLYQIRFDENEKAYIAFATDPYDLQQALLERLGYSIDGQQVSLYDGQRLLATVTNSITDMGGFDDEQPMWIGEQLAYDLSGDAPCLLVTPGVKFTTGLVLSYDDMPTLRAPLTIADGKLSIGELAKQ